MAHVACQPSSWTSVDITLNTRHHMGMRNRRRGMMMIAACHHALGLHWASHQLVLCCVIAPLFEEQTAQLLANYWLHFLNKKTVLSFLDFPQSRLVARTCPSRLIFTGLLSFHGFFRCITLLKLSSPLSKHAHGKQQSNTARKSQSTTLQFYPHCNNLASSTNYWLHTSTA